MAVGYSNTAQALMQRPYGGQSPIGPAGQTDLTRQGQLTSLGGMANQYGVAQQNAQNAQGLSQGIMQDFDQRMQGGQFGWNPAMQSGYNMAGASAGPNQYTGAANHANWAGMNPNRYNQAQGLYGQSAYQPGFGLAGGMVGNTMQNYGGGYSQGMANTINQTGASFDPFNNPALLNSISQANDTLGRDFRQNVMPQFNRAATGAGPGAYGGTRAGVAQGIREQGLADAMAKQTGDMLSQGYEAGLNRYVQDRGQTVNATLDAMRTGGTLGMQGAQMMGNLANMRGNMQQGAASGLAGIAGNQSQAALQAGQNFGSLSAQQQDAMRQAGQVQGGLGSSGLGQQNDMYRTGMSQMPALQQYGFNAAMQPGQIQQQMGGAMQGYGGQQQAHNQNVSNWYNQQYNAAQGYPDQRFGNYSAQMTPFLSAGGVTPAQAVPNYMNSALGGASAGYGLYNAYNQQNTPPATNAGVAAQYGTVPGSQQTNQLYQQQNGW